MKKMFFSLLTAVTLCTLSPYTVFGWGSPQPTPPLAAKPLLIVGNWKMNIATLQEALTLTHEIDTQLTARKLHNIEVILGVPYTALQAVAQTIKHPNLKIAAQDLFWEDVGSVSGTISGRMLKDTGATYVIIGHPSRKKLFHESKLIVKAKVQAALRNGLTPILCIGEKLTDKKQGKTARVLNKQLKRILGDLQPQELEKLIIVYDPAWLLEPGVNKDEFQKAAIVAQELIRSYLKTNFGRAARQVRILATGGVTAANIQELIKMQQTNGALIGAASVQANTFIDLVDQAALANTKQQ